MVITNILKNLVKKMINKNGVLDKSESKNDTADTSSQRKKIKRKKK